MTIRTYLIPRISKPFSATVTLPGSKSNALRQLAIAAVTKGQSTLFGVPACDDSAAMLDCLRALGVKVKQHKDRIEVVGPMNYDKPVILNARMSGASTRLLIGLAALRSGSTTIDGHSSLRERTNAPLFDVLRQHGCRVDSADGKLPVTLSGPLDSNTSISVDGSLSSQYITALMIAVAGQNITKPRHINIIGELVSRPYIDITINELAKRGITARWLNESELVIEPGELTPGSITVEGDATAATYFSALATLHSSQVTLTNLGNTTHQGDYAFCELMAKLGAQVTQNETHTVIKGPQKLQPLPPTDMTSMPDAALTLIAMAPLLPATTHIEGLSSLHHKECDRLECSAKELRSMGVAVDTTQDSTKIQPVRELKAHTLSTYHDHRMAMAFSLLGSVSGSLLVDDKAVVDKTYPDYWLDYGRVS